MGSIGISELLLIAVIGLFTLAIPTGIIVLVVVLVNRSNRSRRG